ncbi:LysR family transcriptional regulator [Vibrio tapetis]|uniref:LysR-family transcriptional regulator n=1 Tax=Vibrio tapetis subsp. tapetis TaxID=1671868 RepID=A0A2N8ZLA6_9VIBR|nr:LysR family transcriptional regulator [Vibrio tapetis]SON52691.1 LysR-family transcriptional regulator [Vibrio tapetis subsp. tapetis]
MDLIKLSRISMKHLVTLHVMLDTLSVTSSAERLCVSPSSVSKILAQLRTSLGDELFYRHGNRLVATPLARRLGPTVHQMLSDMNQLLTQESFDPAKHKGRFSLAMRESTFELLAAKLTAKVLQAAPNVRLEIWSKESLGFDGLANGKLDFILLPHDLSQPPKLTNNLVWQSILHDEMVCLMNPRHPLAAQDLTVDGYLSFDHIGIFDTDLSVPFFELQLAQKHQNRRVVISVADFGSAALMCHQTDLLFTCSKRWAQRAMQANGLVAKPLPFDYGEVAYSLVWHQPSLNDPALRWLHEQIMNLDINEAN